MWEDVRGAQVEISEKEHAHIFLIKPWRSTAFTFFFDSLVASLSCPPAGVAGLRFASQRLMVSVGFAPGVAAFGK